MEENLNSIAEYRLIPEFINNFSGDRKAWRARAIVNILIADKQVSIGGKRYFKDAIMIFENEEVRSELISALRNREALELGRLTYDCEHEEHFFNFLGIVIPADGWIKKLLKLKCRLQYAESPVSCLELQKQCYVG